MEHLLVKVTQQAMNYAIRSGITITASYAFRQSSRLLKVVESNEKEELERLQERLEGKIKIISPAIDMIELISARGNTSLESAVALTQSLRWEIQSLGRSITTAVNEDDKARKGASKVKSKAENDVMVRRIVTQIKTLLGRIEDAVPLINLAITTSGVNLSTSLPSTVSPSRLLQASTFLTAGDSQYSNSTSSIVQIGPTFTLSLYMLFLGHVRPRDEAEVRSTTWKEVAHKARIKLLRVPLDNVYDLPQLNEGVQFVDAFEPRRQRYTSSSEPHIAGEVRSDEFAYQILIVEDLDDDRVHTFEERDSQPGAYDEVDSAGIRDVIPVHEISKIFYADTGKILNIGNEGEMNNPILLLKRDLNAIPPRRMVERLEHELDSELSEIAISPPKPVNTGAYDRHQSEIDAQINRETRESSTVPQQQPEDAANSNSQRIPTNLDPEWLAFEVYIEESGSDTESETLSATPSPIVSSTRPESSQAPSDDSEVISALSDLRLDSEKPASPKPASTPRNFTRQRPRDQSSRSVPTIRTSLSLLETLLRLLSLQQFQQASHLAIPDELLNFFLSESATTGAATGDEAARRRLRAAARQRVGFDPYDESPIKRHGEEYQYRGGASQTGEPWNSEQEGHGNGINWYGQDYEHSEGGVGGFSSSPTPQSFDEGYETHQFRRSPHSALMLRSREVTPDKNRSRRSTANGDADRSRGSTPQIPPGIAARIKETERDRDGVVRRGSPLARLEEDSRGDGSELGIAVKDRERRAGSQELVHE